MQVMRTLVHASIAALALAACSKKKDGPAASTGTGTGGSAAPPAATVDGGGAAAATADEVLPAEAAVDTAAVQKVVDAWLAAQNGGDFAAYQALYADKMEGVKRVGLHASRFDRAGWMTDREKMFKHPMVVTARDVTIGGSPAAPTVELVQTFKQGRFSDEGPKRMVLTRGPAGLLIAREEMVASVVGGPQALGADPVALVVELDGKYHVVISAGADDAWATGRYAGPFEGLHKYATRAATKAPAAATWAGRALQVFSADGKACPATVGDLRLLGGGTPHFGEVQLWDGDPAMSDDGRKWSNAERARAVYQMGDRYLIGQLAITGDCAPAFAMAADAKPTVYARATPDAAVADAAVAAFRKLPAYVAIQGEFDGQGPWAPSPTVTAFAAGDRQFVVVSASEGNGCGEFSGQLAAVFAIQAGKPVLVSNPDDGFFRVDAIVDSDGDGKVELIGAAEDFAMVTAHLTPTAGGFAPTATVTFPYNDCPC